MRLHGQAERVVEVTPHAPYELGLAVAQLCLQAQDEGLVAHQLGGFDADKASIAFAIPDHVRPYAVIAVGYRGGRW